MFFLNLLVMHDHWAAIKLRKPSVTQPKLGENCLARNPDNRTIQKSLQTTTKRDGEGRFVDRNITI